MSDFELKDLGVKMPPAELVERLRPWANQIAARFGHPVWLVGSALEQGLEARDVDVRVVLPDDEFEARYGNPGAARSLWSHSADRRWCQDMAKLSRQAVTYLRINVDLQVQADIEALAYRGRPRVRLDELELEEGAG